HRLNLITLTDVSICRSVPPSETSPVKPPAGDRRTPTASLETVDPTPRLSNGFVTRTTERVGGESQ
ncbi:unnamed protein product, partial [Lactuca virosa]